MHRRYIRKYVPCLLLVKLEDSEEVIIFTISVLVELKSGVVIANVE